MRQSLSPPVYCPICGSPVTVDSESGYRRWWCDRHEIEIAAAPALALMYQIEHPVEIDAPGEATASGYFCLRCSAGLQTFAELPDFHRCPACRLRVPNTYLKTIRAVAAHPDEESPKES